jgi:hypothetical protein
MKHGLLVSLTTIALLAGSTSAQQPDATVTVEAPHARGVVFRHHSSDLCRKRELFTACLQACRRLRLALRLPSGLEAAMATEKQDKLDEFASDLDDLIVTVEELELERPEDGDGENLKTIRAALEQASEATTELENRQEDDL